MTFTVPNAVLMERFLSTLETEFANAGARVVPPDTRPDVLEDGSEMAIQVVEFPSISAAQACLESGGYAGTQDLRDQFTSFDIVTIEEAKMSF